MKRIIPTSCCLFAGTLLSLAAMGLSLVAKPAPGRAAKVLNVHPRPISTDKSILYDYDIVYVRAPRRGDDKQIAWTEVFSPLRAEPGSDLMLLHPDGREEVLVAAGDDAITDPFVSFDGESVYYARIHNVKRPGSPRRQSDSSDIFKVHVKSRKITQLTRQTFTPNTGVIARGSRSPGVYNLAPCPLPGGRVMFTSNRNGFAPTKGYTPTVLQLFTMDDHGGNVEQIGYLNVNSALHPTILKDGRVMFTSYESQGLRDLRNWSVWTIHPDGTNWGPLFSAFLGTQALHFMTQISDGSVIVEEYYNLNNQGFGTYYKMDPSAPPGEPYFGSASKRDPRNIGYQGSDYNRIPFSPRRLQLLTTFCDAFDRSAKNCDPKDPNSPRVGKVTHPSGAPDNHLLTVWSPGPVNSNSGVHKPAIDGGIYLIKSGRPVDEPGQMLLIKNDPRYNEQWPRALVPYKRIHGVDEPARLPSLQNDGKVHKALPEGSPFGLVGTSSLYKRESYPGGAVAEGKVAAGPDGSKDPFQGLGSLSYNPGSINWFIQGADAGRYSNSDIHAIRILVTEPTTDPRHTAHPTIRFWNIAQERLRILGEFPVRKFNQGEPGASATGGQPLDPDGNPDTSFLAKIPANLAWTFQTLDKNGMVLNMAQTWHQVRPDEMRTNCGGCHAHSQKPTDFQRTLAAKADYPVWDLTQKTPLLTTKKHDESGRKWDVEDRTGVRWAKGVLNVEYYRDVKPILERSCAACHTEKSGKPAGNLVLDDDKLVQGPGSIAGLANGPYGKVPGTFRRLALDAKAKFGHKPPLSHGWSHPQASRYVRYFQSRRSLLIWKVFGKRLDGWSNDDFVTEATPGDHNSLVYKGKPVARLENERLFNLAYRGSIMPPPKAVKSGKVKPLTDEDRLTLVRWIDLGCPIDLSFDAAHPHAAGVNGWTLDDNRPTLTLTYPHGGVNPPLTCLLVGMHDYDSGLDRNSFRVVADFAVDGVAAGQNLAAMFRPKSPGVWEMKLSQPIMRLAKGKIELSVKDRQGNVTRIERTFSIAPR
jgi:mono/diheme cytochrome c family protein